MGDGSAGMTPHEFFPYARFLLEHDEDRLMSILRETSRYDSPELAKSVLASDAERTRKLFKHSGTPDLPDAVRVRLVQLLSGETLNRLVLPKGSLYSKFLVLEHPEVASLLSASARKHLVLNQDMRIRYRVAANPSFSRDERVEALCGYRSRGGPAVQADACPERLRSGWESLLPFSDGELDQLIQAVPYPTLSFVFGSLWDPSSEFCHPRLAELSARFLECWLESDLPKSVQHSRISIFTNSLWDIGGYGNNMSPFLNLGESGRWSDEDGTQLREIVYRIYILSRPAAIFGMAPDPSSEQDIVSAVRDFRSEFEAKGVVDPLDVDWDRVWVKQISYVIGKSVGPWVYPLLETLRANPEVAVLPKVREVVVTNLPRLLYLNRSSDDTLRAGKEVGELLSPPFTVEDLVCSPLVEGGQFAGYKENVRYDQMIRAAVSLGCEDLLWSRVPARTLLKKLDKVGYDTWATFCRNNVAPERLTELYSIGANSDMPLTDVVNVIR